jgi:hypothetical protein
MRDRHDGDCTFYASLINYQPTDGICTCGYGWSLVRTGDWSQMFSEEKDKQLEEERIKEFGPVNEEEVEKFLEEMKNSFKEYGLNLRLTDKEKKDGCE